MPHYRPEFDPMATITAAPVIRLYLNDNILIAWLLMMMNEMLPGNGLRVRDQDVVSHNISAMTNSAGVPIRKFDTVIALAF
jgi:hypothetical protein